MLVVNLKADWGLYNGAVGTVVDIVYKDGRRPTDDPTPLPDVVLVRLVRLVRYVNEGLTVVPIVPVSRSTQFECQCKSLQVRLRLAWVTTIHKCQGMTVGAGEPFRYVLVRPGYNGFEARNPRALFVALSMAKSASGEERDPDFACTDVLINNDRFRPVDTPTTRARAVAIERLHVLATQCQQKVLASANREETFLRLLERAQDMLH